MADRLKFICALFAVLALVFACSSNKSDKDKENQTSQKQQQQQPTEPKDQYRIAEIFENDKNQMVDLIEGPASFDIMFDGTGNFKAELLYTDGRPFEVLADVNGSYKGKKVITVPQTSAYILDVHCTGKWSVYKE